MESLALVASLLFLVVLFIGPICYGLSFVSMIPNWIVYILSIFTGFVGLWWISLPLNIIRLLGIIPLYLAYISVMRVQNRKK